MCFDSGINICHYEDENDTIDIDVCGWQDWRNYFILKTKVNMTIEITVDNEVTMERFNKLANKTTMEEYRELLLESLENAPFQVNKIGLISKLIKLVWIIVFLEYKFLR